MSFIKKRFFFSSECASVCVCVMCDRCMCIKSQYTVINLKHELENHNFFFLTLDKQTLVLFISFITARAGRKTSNVIDIDAVNMVENRETKLKHTVFCEFVHAPKSHIIKNTELHEMKREEGKKKKKSLMCTKVFNNKFSTKGIKEISKCKN